MRITLRKKMTFLTVLLIMVLSFLFAENGFASSVALSVSGGGNYEIGDSVSVTVKYTGATFGAATGKISYDSSVLEYVSCSGAEAFGNGGTVTYTMSSGSGTDALVCKLTFKAIKAGSSEVTASTSDIYNLDLEELSCGSKSVTVKIEDSSTKASSNANLSAMEVSAGTLVPAFSPSVTVYSVQVENSVTVCTISVNKADSKATVAVSGSKNLKEGNNVRKVIVTAENGKTKTYTINITRGSSSSTSEGNKDNDSDNGNNSAAQPEQILVTLNNIEYIVCENIDGATIPEGFTTSAATYEDIEIPVISDEKNHIAMILLEKKDGGNREWFFYNDSEDKISSEITLSSEQLLNYYKSDSVKEPESDETTEENPSISDERIITGMMLALLGTVILLLVVLICLQIRILRSRKKSKE